jgi:sec-independent protein translocase protein TatA
MMFNLGPLEIGAIIVLALLVFGPRRLPEMGKAIGSAITEFRSSMSGASAKKDDEVKETKSIPEDVNKTNTNTPVG